MSITIDEAKDIVNDILRMFPKIHFTSLEKADLVLLVVKTAPNCIKTESFDNFIRSTIFNNIEAKLKDCIVKELEGE
ncbi:MAG: hypothetical protein ACI4XM_01180 [Candidatus Coprovivens sp.]